MNWLSNIDIIQTNRVSLSGSFIYNQPLVNSVRIFHRHFITRKKHLSNSFKPSQETIPGFKEFRKQKFDGTGFKELDASLKEPNKWRVGA